MYFILLRMKILSMQIVYYDERIFILVSPSLKMWKIFFTDLA